MKSLLLKISTRFEKYSIWKLSVYSIALSGIFLAILSAVKLVDQMLPQIVAGIPFWEVYWSFAVLCVIVLPFAPCVLTLALAPIMWMLMGQTYLLTPASFILDYTLPVLSVLIIKLAMMFKLDKKVNTKAHVEKYVKNANVRKFLSFNFASLEMWSVVLFIWIAATIKYFSHVFSGVKYYEATWQFSFEFNAPFTFINAAMTTAIVFWVYKPLQYLRDSIVLKEKNRW